MRAPFGLLVVVALAVPAALMSMDGVPEADLTPSQTAALPKIAAAPGFTLTSQDGAQITLASLRGKVVAVTFIFTRCIASCPVLTPMMSLVQARLGRDFGRRIVFASVTVDPEHDTPQMLKLYAQMYGADVEGWSFLTGPPPVVADLIHRYGAFAAKNANGEVEHSFLTSIVDQRGIIRVQYLGTGFDPEEVRRDLVAVMNEQ
jgi:protein SCO1